MQPERDWRATLPPEIQLLLCCAHARLDGRQLAQMRVLLASDLNWKEVLALAAHQHLEPLLYQNLKLTSELIPAVWMDVLRQSARKAEAIAFLYFSELARIAALFESEKIPLIPYKGPVLAWLAYGGLTRRRFVDLDFFTPQQFIPRATALLKSAGFRANFGPSEEHAGQNGYAPGQYGFTRLPERLHVEVHTERTLRYFPRPLPFEEMMPRLIVVNAAGCALRTFSIEDTLLMLCVHGAKHLWERLAWIADVAELTGSQTIDWASALEIARKVQCTRALLLGLALAHELLEAPVNPELLEQARRDANVRTMVRRLREGFCKGIPPYPGVWQRANFRFGLRQGNWQGIRHMARLSLTPTESDREEMRLPRLLAPLYLFVRPWRLIRVYGTGLSRRAGRK